MSKLQLHTVRAKNFRSIGNTWEQIDFEASPDTLVVSEDNGQGKSTMLIHATFYALFDKAYGDGDKKTSLINSVNRKDTLVELELTSRGKRYLISRGMKPTVFDIKVMGESGEFITLDQEAGLDDHQAVLDEITGIDASAFCNSIALGVDKFKPFINMKTAERRPFVERILGLEVFTKLADRAKERIKTNTRTLTDTEYELKIKDGQVTSKVELLELREQNAGDKIQSVESNIARMDRELEDANPKRTELEQKSTLIDAKIDEVKLAQSGDLGDLTGSQMKIVDDMKDLHDQTQQATKDYFAKVIEPKRDSFNDNLAEFDDGQKKALDVLKCEQMAKVQHAPIPFDGDLALANAAVESAERKSEEAYGILQTFDTDLQQTRRQLAELNSTIQTEVSNRDRTQKGIDEIYAQGSCPSCTQAIPDSLKDQTSANSRSLVEDMGQRIASFEEDRTELTTSFDAMQAKWNSAEATYSQSMKTLESARQRVKSLSEERSAAVEAAKDSARDTINARIQEQADERTQFIINNRSEIDNMQKAHDKELNDMAVLQSNELNSVKLEHSEEIRAMESKHSETTSKLTNLDTQVKSQISAITTTIAKLSAERNGYIDDLAKLKGEAAFDFDGAKQEIADLEMEVAVMNAEFEKLSEEQAMLKVLANQILTDKGIKASILDKYLPFINQRVNAYLNSMNVYLNLEMDNTYTVTMNAPDRRGQTVYSLSNGQKARLNCAFMLAWRDVADMRSSTSCNLLVLDETLENISENGVKEAIDLVKQASKGKNLFVISQRNSEFEEHFKDTITYTLKDGYTGRM